MSQSGSRRGSRRSGSRLLVSRAVDDGDTCRQSLLHPPLKPVRPVCIRAIGSHERPATLDESRCHDEQAEDTTQAQDPEKKTGRPPHTRTLSRPNGFLSRLQPYPWCASRMGRTSTRPNPQVVPHLCKQGHARISTVRGAGPLIRSPMEDLEQRTSGNRVDLKVQRDRCGTDTPTVRYVWTNLYFG